MCLEINIYFCYFMKYQTCPIELQAILTHDDLMKISNPFIEKHPHKQGCFLIIIIQVLCSLTVLSMVKSSLKCKSSIYLEQYICKDVIKNKKHRLNNSYI